MTATPARTGAAIIADELRGRSARLLLLPFTRLVVLVVLLFLFIWLVVVLVFVFDDLAGGGELHLDVTLAFRGQDDLVDLLRLVLIVLVFQFEDFLGRLDLGLGIPG